ncbi:hypothetical protein C8J57DRAFT_1240562 [Mycena rebaudengoi]|nr:hypothetical protein C8J57DRAFT_1240562 [Mycena rebaudengoi]
MHSDGLRHRYRAEGLQRQGNTSISSFISGSGSSGAGSSHTRGPSLDISDTPFRPFSAASNASYTSHAPTTPLHLPSDLVHTLFECFLQLPPSSHLAFRGSALRALLSSASWQIDSLPPPARALAYCAVAHGATISFHPGIIGPGGADPASFAAGDFDSVPCHQKLSNAAPAHATRVLATHAVVGNSLGRIMIIRGINTSGISLPLPRFCPTECSSGFPTCTLPIVNATKDSIGLLERTHKQPWKPD